MAVINFDIEFVCRMSVNLEVPDAIETMDEHGVRQLITSLMYPIIVNSPKEKIKVVKNSQKIVKKPEFIKDNELESDIVLTIMSNKNIDNKELLENENNPS